VPKSRFTEFNLDPALAEAVESAPDQQVIEGIVRLEDPTQIPAEFRVVCQFIRICTGRFLAEDAWTIRRHPNVISLKAARPLGISHSGDISPEFAKTEDFVWRGRRPLSFAGRGSIVAALDFGLDFGHPNFLNPDGSTRVMSFWHQGATYDFAHPNRYGYGRVFSRDEIKAALRSSDPYRALGYHPAISDTGNGSHGTHTLDIAAGNGRSPGSNSGIAPEAEIIFVHLSTPRLGVVGDLGDSVRMLEALDFAHRTAADRPCVVNLSVGREAGSHDATSPFEQAMHELLRMGTGKNRAICQSAGNYGSAHLAVNGWLREGEQRDLQWIVHPQDPSPEIDAWYSGNDRFLAQLLPPDGGNPVEVRLGEVSDINHDGALVGRIYHRKNDPNNRDNHVEVFLYKGCPPGVWILRLLGEYVITGRFHAWVERGIPGGQSHFDRKITSRNYTLGTIATSPLVITVGAYDANADRRPLASFSSCGPTRDERNDKPEILAPGVRVVAARSIPRGAVRQEGLIMARSGTSMATPHLTGLVAAMFEAAGRPVSIAEIRECLKQSADAVTNADSPNCCAWGRVNMAEAIRRIRELNSVATPQPQTDSQTDSPLPWFVTTEAEDSDPASGTDGTSGRKYEASPEQEQEIETPAKPDIESPRHSGLLTNSAFTDRLLDQAEQAVRSSYGKRGSSEISFLKRLWRELEGDVCTAKLSPSALFRAALHDMAFINRRRSVLEVLATASQPLPKDLRSGDWMIRALPGTGDVGHVSVIASDNLLVPSVLAAWGIAAESRQPGYYGLVVEAGAFPHTRSRPFARRLLDSRGLVPPHTVLLRPTHSGASVTSYIALDEPDVHADSSEDTPAAALPQAPVQSQEPPAPGPLDLDRPANDADNDIVLIIVTIEKPGDVSQYWADEVRPNPTHWAHPLSELEQGYIDAMTDPGVPQPLRMRAPVDPGKMTSEEAADAGRLFGAGTDAARRYANYENRRRILANYVHTHPATVRLELGLYRLVRDVNPVRFALERGWQIGSGKEMFTGQEVSRLGAAFEFVASLAFVYGVGKVLQATRPVTGMARTAPRSLTDPIYDLPPEGGGMRINNRWYTEHALERMAPKTPQIREEIRARIVTRLGRIGITSDHPAFGRILARAVQGIDPRGVPPSVVESEILRPGSTNVRVITARRGGVVVSVIPRRSPPVPPAPTESDLGEDFAPQQMETWVRRNYNALGEDLGEQTPPTRFCIVFYDQESLRYLDGWTRATGPSAVFLIDRPSYAPLRADGVKRGQNLDLFLAQALKAGRRGMDMQPPMFVLDPKLATVPLNPASKGDWDDLMIAQLIGASHRLTIQSETDQWKVINGLFAKAKEDARQAARDQRAAREFAAYMVLDTINATLAMAEASVTMGNGDANIPLGQVRGSDHKVVPGHDAEARVIGDIHTHYLLDPLIDLNRSSVGTTIRYSTTSIHSGVSDVDVNAARKDQIVKYAVDSKYLHRAQPNGTKNDELPRSGDVLREALRVFAGEPGLSSSD
jgi:subtilisin family serine protease